MSINANEVIFSFMNRVALCGGVYSGVNGTISSPNYPSDYPNYMYCVYTITVPYDTVCIEFIDFNISYVWAYVTVYEGVTLAKRIGR